MAIEAILNLANLVVWLAGLFWVNRLKRTAKRQDAVDIGAAGNYRPALLLLGPVLAACGYYLILQGREAPPATLVLLSVSLGAQVVGLVAIDRWHHFEENHPRSRVEMYSDLAGCSLMLGVTILAASEVVPAAIVAVRLAMTGR